MQGRSKNKSLPKVITKTVAAHPDGQEYIVALKADVDHNAFWDKMETAHKSTDAIPSRAVRVLKQRPNVNRLRHYAITSSEAATLRGDARVHSVTIPIQHKNNAVIKPYATQYNNFDKTTNSVGNNVNWGLSRVNSAVNNYGVSYSVIGQYNYTLDGTGVDVLVVDTGLEVNHPEFKDANGNSRVQQIDWYAASGVSGTMPSGHYSDVFGHGTHVTGIAAGKTFGWAKNAQIYSIKLEDLVSPIDTSGLPYSDIFDIMIGWHNNKPIDPTTGYKRPTIVNMSWGITGSYYITDSETIITGGNYRGTPWSGSQLVSDIHTEYGMGSQSIGTFPIRDPATDIAIDEMIAAGIHVCIAAGNDGIKIDAPLGPDYQNYFTDIYDDINFYNQGSSPYSTNANIVGAIDINSYSQSQDQKVFFSEGGPGVSIYSPGTGITSSMSRANEITNDGYEPAPYFLDTSWLQANLDGTSMASPQVCGLGALFLQINPHAAPAQLQSWLTYNSQTTLYDTGLNNDYSNFNSLWGSEDQMLFNKFNSNTSLNID